MTQLAFDFDVAPDWVPLYKPYGLNLLSLLMDRGCRDCGGKVGGGTGGANEIGIYGLCDDCSGLDGCLTRVSRYPGRHVSYWGDGHAAVEHDALIVEREKRRNIWRRRAARSINEGASN